MAVQQVVLAPSAKLPPGATLVIRMAPRTASHPWVKTWDTSGGLSNILFQLSHSLAGFDVKAASDLDVIQLWNRVFRITWASQFLTTLSWKSLKRPVTVRSVMNNLAQESLPSDRRFLSLPVCAELWLLLALVCSPLRSWK
jgi:hypothetical protein